MQIFDSSMNSDLVIRIARVYALYAYVYSCLKKKSFLEIHKYNRLSSDMSIFYNRMSSSWSLRSNSVSALAKIFWESLKLLCILGNHC